MRSPLDVRAVYALLALMMLTHTNAASADEVPCLPAPRATPRVDRVHSLSDLDLVRERNGAAVERGMGIGITLTGIAVGVGSTAYLIVGYARQSGGSGGGLGALGPLMDGGTGMGIGLALGAMGIPLWVHGQRRVGRANDEAHEREKTHASLTLTPSFAPVAGGALGGLSASF
jgi:hypothetical protein